MIHFIDLDLVYQKNNKNDAREFVRFFLKHQKRQDTIPKELGIVPSDFPSYLKSGIKISSELRPPPLETNENEIIVPGDIVRATQKKTRAS